MRKIREWIRRSAAQYSWCRKFLVNRVGKKKVTEMSRTYLWLSGCSFPLCSELLPSSYVDWCTSKARMVRDPQVASFYSITKLVCQCCYCKVRMKTECEWTEPAVFNCKSNEWLRLSCMHQVYVIRKNVHSTFMNQTDRSSTDVVGTWCARCDNVGVQLL